MRNSKKRGEEARQRNATRPGFQDIPLDLVEIDALDLQRR
jgi:hypothetical protein